MSGFQQQKIGFFGDKVIGNRYRSFAIFLRKAGTSFLKFSDLKED
jgi:hypothetical protein